TKQANHSRTHALPAARRWKKIRFNQEDGASRPQACNEIRDRLVSVGDMVKHRTGSYKIETARLHRPGYDIVLPKLQIRQMHVDERKIEIDGHGSSIRSDLPGKPRGN